MHACMYHIYKKKPSYIHWNYYTWPPPSPPPDTATRSSKTYRNWQGVKFMPARHYINLYLCGVCVLPISNNLYRHEFVHSDGCCNWSKAAPYLYATKALASCGRQHPRMRLGFNILLLDYVALSESVWSSAT